MCERAEQGLVEQFIAQSADEGFGKGILHRLARRDVMPVNLVIVGPLQDGVRGQLGAVVADDGLGLAVGDQELVEFASHPDAQDRGVGDQGQAFPRAVVDHDQDAHAAAVEELIGDKVQRPAVVWPLRDEHRCPCAQGPLAAAATANHETFLAIEPEQPLVVYRKALRRSRTCRRR